MRGPRLLALNSVYSPFPVAAAGGASAWLFLSTPDPVRTIAWAVGVFALATIFGSISVLLALLHLVRYRTDPGWAIICLAVNAIALAVTWVPQAL